LQFLHTADVVNEKHATTAPDLVVEIVSPGTRRAEGGVLETPLFPGLRIPLREVFRGR